LIRSGFDRYVARVLRHASGQGHRAASVTAAACTALGFGAGIGHAQPASDVRAAAERHITALYQQAEAATQQYDADEERIARLQAAIDDANSQSVQTRQRLNSLDGGLGRLAAQQYRDPDYSSALALLFATHPDDYLQRAGMNSRVAALDAQQVHDALEEQRQLDALSTLGGQEMQQLRATQTQLAATRTLIQTELAQARQQLADLDAADRRAVSFALVHGAVRGGIGVGDPAHAPSLGTLLSAMASGSSGQGVDSERAQKAIKAAYSELGKPYVWGAVGPDSFDCSGLTQHSWSQAGVMLPRTSQEQANAGQTVSLSDIQPGDLVIYFPGRTHVGMYVGDGLIIHAPHPGSAVQFAPVTAMPINTIVRPAGN
jgi:cell wall-associated NlpC family hydrolase